MAWRCSGATNAALVHNLRQAKLIHSDRVAEAMAATDRACYVQHKDEAYIDAPQSIGYQATISAPHMHAMAAELVEPLLQPGARALDVGCGSGYLVAVLARLLAPLSAAAGSAAPAAASSSSSSSSEESGTCRPSVVGIDYIPELVDLSRRNLDADDATLLKSGHVKLVLGDGYKGFPECAPYDAIHVGAAAPEVPEALLGQLKVGGKMVIPVGPTHGAQVLWEITRKGEDKFEHKHITGVRYVPLVPVDDAD